TCEEALLALEKAPENPALMALMLRGVHNLKGNARIGKFEPIAELVHVMEDLLVDLRDGRVEIDGELVSRFLAGIDALRSVIPKAVAGTAGAFAELEQAALVIDRQRAQGTTTTIPTSDPATAPEAAAEEQAPDQPVRLATGFARNLRVSIEKLDQLLNLVGEIAIARGQVTEMLEHGQELTRREIIEAHRESDLLYMDLQELVMKMRMVPVGPLFREYTRTVRDLSRELDRDARLVIAGEEVEVDTTVIEHLRDPLTHLIRNAIHHGIEPPAQRLERGKSPTGTITLRASHDAGFIVIAIADDGAGLPHELIAAQARERNLLGPAESLDDGQLLELVLEPGFSTAAEVSEVSGRGVGMDVVRRNVELLRGSILLASRPGEGTTWTLRLPLTLAIIEGFRVGVGDESYVVPLDSVVECLEMPAECSRRSDGRGVIQLRGKPVPFIEIRTLFDLGGEPDGRENLIVVRHDEFEAGLAVDRLYGEAQTVIKPLNKLFDGIPGLAGTAILGNGRVAFVLDVPGLLRHTLDQEAELN
ncbi:MAG: chemotaxis protein CheA, partial [bacterium]|nr:chemotaxis protein CheA [bacterium]